MQEYHEFSDHKFSLPFFFFGLISICFQCSQISKELSDQLTEVVGEANCSEKLEA